MRNTNGQGRRLATPMNRRNLSKRVGRYEIKQALGQGAFAHVYLARDSQLGRLVAVKVPNDQLLESGLSVETFLAEARHAASLNHPRVVAIHDIQKEGGRPYIVQEYIDGSPLGDWVRDQRPAREALARLFIEITEAVGFAHRQGLIHRDLKPANILIDRDGHAHVADFGLAVHKSTQWALAGDVSGTPIYMSPEQIRGETHRLDGRTDLWSLGVILYELLTGARPFQAERRSELFERIQTATPRPPRRLDPQIPPELERICLKCLEKRRSDRYCSADELIDDLRHWLEPREPRASRSVPPVRIVPKGLRSFDASDADFFLDLLPGPRDREGLPESIRFWKTRIEQTDPAESFSVGVIYGPSGCGKSSLVKAGLLPRLTRDVLPIYVEATPEETEARLLRKLADHVPNIDTGESLPDVMRRLREQDGPKVLILLDQFEQWLHARPDDGSEPLIDALRHCDESRLQCIALVRDDFWMALTRFLRELEIEWHEGRNSRAVDLFPARHAEEVLTKFGRAFRTLPDDELTSAQQQFITQSVASLAEDGKVVCVRLALFAEMMKDKPWTPSSLKAVGGPAGVGVMFLEETFSSTAAPPEYRHHQAAVREVFKALLPESATDIKGHTRSYDELLQVSGYAHRPHDFQRLINILDRELRLVIPAEGKDEGGRRKDEGGRMKQNPQGFHPSSFRLHPFPHPSTFRLHPSSSSPTTISFHRSGSG
jgi:serine/threonine protein kinase